jgi:hypothetical protein
VVEKIVWLRKHYHFGPAKIAMCLARYHDLTISTSRVWRILKRLQLNRLPASQRYRRHSIRWKRYEKQRPGPVAAGGTGGLTAKCAVASGLAKRAYMHPAARDGGADRRPSSRCLPVAAATVISLAGLLWGGLGGDHAADCPTARRSSRRAE